MLLAFTTKNFMMLPEIIINTPLHSRELIFFISKPGTQHMEDLQDRIKE